MLVSLLISSCLHIIAIATVYLFASSPHGIVMPNMSHQTIKARIAPHAPLSQMRQQDNTTPVNTQPASQSKAFKGLDDEQQSPVIEGIDDALKQAQQERLEIASGLDQLKQEAEMYHQALQTAVTRLWNVPLSALPDQDCEYLVHLSPSGYIIDLELVRSSGNDALDRSVKQAIIKAEPLPIPKDSNWYHEFKVQRLVFGPRHSIGQ
ncbi:MAG: hypothetical protein CMF46_04750 [Legionellales bacterium]|nr:hypothetical protein [Legionellales bacterium]|tara:strand:+ start:865 stop:1485 length:621 start_codon:yes stop_codon:yes gene_type:complete